jgi:HD-like signal output (HDOD) protein
MRRILFVDDEANVLQGLKRLLHPMRREWETSFSQSGQDALQTLANESFDVIVSDMRMPGMDGAALLSEVMRHYPDMVRIILSGHSSQESTMKTIGVAHQFLAKPCDADQLKRTIEHAFALRDLLADEKLKGTLSQLGSVPSMPQLYKELLEELRYPDASAKRVGQIVAQDPGMTAKVLQLVNSAFFGLARRVVNPEQATAMLGVDTMKVLVLGIDVFSQFSGTGVEGLGPETIQRHCSHTANIAKQIAVLEKAPKDVIDASLMAGFLHDIGKLILAQNLPEKYAIIMGRSRKEGLPLCQVEREELGSTHAAVGAYLLGLWGLPSPIVEATAFHHEPSLSYNDTFSALTAVHVADILGPDHADECDASEAEKLDLPYLQRVGVADRLDEWKAKCFNLECAGGKR